MPKLRRPPCTNCGSRPALVHVSPLETVHELRIYECKKCGRVDCFEVTAGPISTWSLLQGERLTQIVKALKDETS